MYLDMILSFVAGAWVVLIHELRYDPQLCGWGMGVTDTCTRVLSTALWLGHGWY